MRKYTRLITCLCISCLTVFNASGQTFVDINAGIINVSNGSADWGDYDNDRDMDLLLSGQTPNGLFLTKIYNNSNGNFTDINAGLEGINNGSVAWGDYDNDGDLDILMTGENLQEKTFIYKNEEGSFININLQIDYFGDFSFANWGDYDNDGDLDLFITGNWNTALYSNNGNDEFSITDNEFIMLSSGRATWADMDEDRDLDLLVTGDTGGGMKLYLYTNDEGSFSETELSNPGLASGSIEAGDYDSDGDLDILISGFDDYIAPATEIYRNDGNNNFVNIWGGLAPVAVGRTCWGDYDNDGDLDIALTGKLAGCGVFATEIYENLGNDYFNGISAPLQSAEYSYIAWGDYDNDTDLDLFLSGSSYTGGPFTKIYRNDISLPNFIPGPPQNLTVDFTATDVILSWDDGSDTQTDALALSYNIRLGTSSLLCNNISPMAHMDDGYRKIAMNGNTSLSNSWKLKNLEEGTTYYWSVQTIDNTFASSVFADEQSFTVLYTDVEPSQSHSESIKVYPNPANDYISLSGNNIGLEDTFGIYSIAGQKLFEFSVSSGKKIDVKILERGLYFIKNESKESIYFTKLVLQ